MIDFLYDTLSNNYLMLTLWCIPLLYALYITKRRKLNWIGILAIFCIPFLMYFIWAISDIWDTHEAALAFNRSAQVVAIVILVLFLAGLYERK
jgi:hypothetical protein